MIYAIFVNQRHGTHPHFILRQKYIEVLYNRLFLFYINLTGFPRIGMFHNPNIAAIRLDVLAGKAFVTGHWRVDVCPFFGKAHAFITIVLVKTVDEEIGIVVGLCRSQINGAPSVSTRFGERSATAPYH